jgi:hypothetical protein
MTTYIGTFSKGVTGAVTLNFAPSGGKYCSDTCPLKGNGCYAQHVEKMKPSVKLSNERKARVLSNTLAEMLARLDTAAPWIRLSAFGSVPSATQLTEKQTELFRQLGEKLAPVSERVHFPVETASKYKLYTRLGFFPRLSLGNNPSSKRLCRAMHADEQISLVADTGDRKLGWTKRQIDYARALRRKLQKRFPAKTVKVCPAVAGSAKCGECTLCGRDGADIVIYPRHP